MQKCSIFCPLSKYKFLKNLRSTSGFMFSFGSGVVTLDSKKQEAL